MGLSGCERAGHHEADVALLEQVADAVAAPGLGAGVGDQVEAEGGGEEPGEGAGVAHPPLEVVDAAEGRGPGAAWSARSSLDPRLVVGPQPVPERLHAVEHPGGAGEEALLVEPRLGERLDELVVGVGGVLVLDLVVPGPERQRQARGTRAP